MSTLVAMVTHWNACMQFMLATQERFADESVSCAAAVDCNGLPLWGTYHARATCREIDGYTDPQQFILRASTPNVGTPRVVDMPGRSAEVQCFHSVELELFPGDGPTLRHLHRALAATAKHRDVGVPHFHDAGRHA
eukprot:811891-Prymnesium_polylepis.1